jgi:hypothetical protein
MFRLRDPPKRDSEANLRCRPWVKPPLGAARPLPPSADIGPGGSPMRLNDRPGSLDAAPLPEAMQRTPEPSPLRQARRCLAKTRRGTLCQSPATSHGRCRMHGGAPGTGAPKGKRNGSWKHGRYSQDHIELRRAMRALLREARAMLSKWP